ncbi:MarR family winged helix-turn-helix transcriptional regulator [Parasphingopyxis marina]|uniref:Winged helix-turn-helix transcriptional regulator n=1 Tax=Parasphingopyxis marina TaxID=2761622 RepID=A0A842HUC0_9SPHN|nr:MarR family winged helix-turn-helix transcriptional regulator [Parasphingopyxis marina]MBC2776007.1 winged helix-turn-helix transcriptional regulator [Parasphingopyxis marina]
MAEVATVAASRTGLLPASPKTAAAPTDREIMQVFLTKPAFLLGRFDQICTAFYAELSSGETLAQAEILLLLDWLDDCDQISLARAAGIDTSTMALIIDNLETAGLAERRPDPVDRRRVRPRLTGAGVHRIGQVRASFSALQKGLIAPLETREEKELQALLWPLATSTDGPAPAWSADPENPLSGSPSFLGRRALQMAQALFIASTAELKLTPRQFSALFILALRPATSQVEFARIFGLDPSTCGVILRNLLARQLITGRLSRRDRRKRLYSATDAGRETLALAQPLVDQSEALTLVPFSTARVSRLVAILREVVLVHSVHLRFPGKLGFDEE